MNLAIPAARVDGEVPRRIVVERAGADRQRHAVVIQLADACGEPPVRLEKLRERDGLRQLLAEMRRHRISRRRVRQHAGGIGSPSRQKRRPARAAQRVLRVDAVELHPARGELVDVRRPHRRAVDAEIVVQIVGDQEQDVESRTRLRLRTRGRGRKHQRSQTTNDFQQHTHLAVPRSAGAQDSALPAFAPDCRCLEIRISRRELRRHRLTREC